MSHAVAVRWPRTSANGKDRSLFPQATLDSVRIFAPDGIRRAAEMLNDLAIAHGFRAAPAHDIAGKQTPVDIDGEPLASTVFGWSGDDKVWWRNTRIALDSPITSACRFEGEPFWVNAAGFRTRLPNNYLAAIDLTNFEHRAMTQAAIVVPVHMPFGQIGAVSFNPLDRGVTELDEAYMNLGDELGLYARTFITSYVHVMGSVQALPSGTRLVETRSRMPALGFDRQDRYRDQHDHGSQPRDGPLPHPQRIAQIKCGQSQPDGLQGRAARLSVTAPLGAVSEN